jgi:hypothetical protein
LSVWPWTTLNNLRGLGHAVTALGRKRLLHRTPVGAGLRSGYALPSSRPHRQVLILIVVGSHLDCRRPAICVVEDTRALLKRKGIAPSLDRELTEVIDGAPVRLGLFSKEFYREHLGLALWFAYHRSLNPESFGCLQMLWPDKRGHFPFETGCEAKVRRIQTPVNLAH